MNIRNATTNDLDGIDEIDSVIESTEYLHIEKSGDGAAMSFQISQRPLREKMVSPNRLPDDSKFILKQIVSGNDEGFAIVAEHDGQIVALLLAQVRPGNSTMEIIDLRIDYDYRRQGLATVLIYQLIERAKEADLRAVHATGLTNNIPAVNLFQKLGFELSGMDIRRNSNHDLVKEAVTLLWYYEIT